MSSFKYWGTLQHSCRVSFYTLSQASVLPRTHNGLIQEPPDISDRVHASIEWSIVSHSPLLIRFQSKRGSKHSFTTLLSCMQNQYVVCIDSELWLTDQRLARHEPGHVQRAALINIATVHRELVELCALWYGCLTPSSVKMNDACDSRHV